MKERNRALGVWGRVIAAVGTRRREKEKDAGRGRRRQMGRETVISWKEQVQEG